MVRHEVLRPTGVERTFAAEEIIVSKTNSKGLITYANDVFLRVSAYPESAILGRPHNAVRHPDMPRAVFKLLWDTISSGEEIFAYVLNLAGDGAHYWVLAHVTPSMNAAGQITGYHSNRRSPDGGAVNQVKSLYQRLREVELLATSAQEAVAASTETLRSFLGDRGQSYDEYVWQLTNEAVAASSAASR